MKKIVTCLARTGVSAAVLALALIATPSFAQVPSSNPPYNTDPGALITDTLSTVGVRTSATQTNLDKVGVTCVYNVTAYSGSPSISFNIDGFDAASNSWVTYKASNTITPGTGGGANNPVNTPFTVSISPAIATSGLANANMVAINLHMPRVWRVQRTLSGSLGPAVSGTLGCNNLK